MKGDQAMKINRRKALAVLAGAPAILLHRRSFALGPAVGSGDDDYGLLPLAFGHADSIPASE